MGKPLHVRYKDIQSYYDENLWTDPLRLYAFEDYGFHIELKSGYYNRIIVPFNTDLLIFDDGYMIVGQYDFIDPYSKSFDTFHRKGSVV